MEKLTVALLVKDQEEHIGACLESVKWADEIVILDGFSKDRTVEICRRYTGNVYQKAFEGFNTERTFLLGKASNKWVFFIDSDMLITPELAAEIKETLAGPRCSGYRIKGLTMYLGRGIHHCGWFDPVYLRLFNREKGYYDEKMMYIDNFIISEGQVGELKSHFIHHGYRDITEHIAKMNRYTSLDSLDLEAKGLALTPLNAPYYLAVRPALVFAYKYFYKAGFLDGYPGFVVSALSAVTYMLSAMKLAERQWAAKGNYVRDMRFRRP